MRPRSPEPLFGRPVRRIHCLGAGGMGMAPLSVYLAQAGYEVSGEDDALSDEVRDVLVRGGVSVGPLPEGADLVVRSSAVGPAHPAAAAAAARGLPVVRRGEMLAEAVRGRRLVAVCGSHGKTTTTAMLVTALRQAGFPAGWVLGGLFKDGTPPARAGSNEWVVAEIDESDGTIDAFSPEIAVAVNLDWDHPDRYRSLDELEATFAALFSRTSGPILVSDACARSLRVAGAARETSARTATFGRSGDFAADIAAEDGDSMTLRLGGRFGEGEAPVRARGGFNASNAAAALAAARLMGAEVPPRALAAYPGVRRRQGVLWSGGGITAIEDYAHHPSEIRALLGSLRRAGPGRPRLIAVFQPHRFTRTAQFKAEFAAALALADRVHLLDVYPAGEKPSAGGTTADIYAEMRLGSPSTPVDYLPGGGAELVRTLVREAAPGDVIAFVGAGDIDRLARDWVDAHLKAVEAARGWDELSKELGAALSRGAKVRREEPLAPRTTLRVGGAARVLAEPAGEDDLRALLRVAGRRPVPVLVLGRGSNLVVPDEGVDGIVISLAHPSWSRFEPLGGGRVRVGAGLRLKNLCGLAAQAGLAGFEFLEGIPGTVGGALRMNAGAMGGWMFDVVEELDLVALDGEPRTMRRDALRVGYRHCSDLRDAIAVSAVLRGQVEFVGPAEGGTNKLDLTPSIARRIDAYRNKRHETQPREPSAGCIFKNPEGSSAGRLIDEAGLKGERVGDAQVSPVHANFIVNLGHATGTDVLELIRRVRTRVKAATGVDLEPEAMLYGKDWRDVL